MHGEKKFNFNLPNLDCDTKRVTANSLADLADAKVTNKSLHIAGIKNKVYTKANIFKLLCPYGVKNTDAKIFLNIKY